MEGDEKGRGDSRQEYENIEERRGEEWRGDKSRCDKKR